MAQATFSWPCGPIHLEKRHGVGAIGRNGCAAPASMPPIPYGSQKIFRNWVGEVQGPPADPLGPGGPVCRPYKKTARATARVAPTVLREAYLKFWRVGEDTRPYGGYRSRPFFS